MAQIHRSNERAARRRDADDDDVDDEGGAGEEREYTSWRWLLGGVLVVALVAVVVFAIKQSNAELRAEVAEKERAKLEADGPAGGRAKGDVNYVIFCAGAQPGPHGLDISGALDQVAVPEFPAKLSFSAVVSITPDRAGRRYEMARFNEQGKVEFAQELKLEGGTSVASVNVMTVKELEVREPGEVVFRVFRDGMPVAERVLRVGGQTSPARPGAALGTP
jgi:heme exporter protein D